MNEFFFVGPVFAALHLARPARASRYFVADKIVLDIMAQPAGARRLVQALFIQGAHFVHMRFGFKISVVMATLAILGDDFLVFLLAVVAVKRPHNVRGVIAGRQNQRPAQNRQKAR